MDKSEQRALDILKGLGGRPATPFFEEGVASYILGALTPLKIDLGRDEYGNVIAHYKSGASTGQPAIAFVAHMDHPGYEVIAAGGGKLIAKAMGGVPAASYTRPTAVLVVMPDGRRVRGTAAGYGVQGTGHGVTAGRPTPSLSPGAATSPPSRGRQSPGGDEHFVQITLGEKVEVKAPASVVFDLPDFVLDGDTDPHLARGAPPSPEGRGELVETRLIRMRALDDLAGCAAIVAMFERVVAEKAEADVYGVFTRAEEGGLFGARLLAQSGLLPKDTIIVSVESSAVIPGVSQGAGPVIRTGDAAYTFDADAEQVMIAARESIRQRNKEFKCQRQLMSGGVCEATAFAVFGYSVTGMAFPLGNYHNATTKAALTPASLPGGERTEMKPADIGGVGAEYINLADFLGGVELLAEAAKSVSKRSETPIRKRLREVSEDVKARLRGTWGA